MRFKMNYFLWMISIFLLISSLFTCDDPTAVLQTFTLNLLVNEADRGTTNPEDMVKVNNGKPLSISALPSSGYEFNEWEIISGVGVTLKNKDSLNTSVTLTEGNATIMAIFSLIGAPYGYSVEINPDILNFTDDILSFTFTHNNWTGGEEIYYYSIDDDNNDITPPVTGSGTVTGTEQTVNNINISSLDDGLLSLAFHISAAGIDGNDENDTVTKDTEPPDFITVDASGDDIYMDGETITFTVNLVELGLDVLTVDLSVLDATASTEYPLTHSGGNNYTCSFYVNDATAIPGTHSIKFTATDYMDQTSTDSSLSVTLDFTAPSGSFYIDGTDDPADEYTLTTSVNLNSTITGAAQMRFGNSVAERNAASWEAYASTKIWTFSSGVDEKTVYGAFRDTAGNELLTTDTIIYMKKLTASNGALNDNYGKSVSVSSDGSNVAVGADGDNSLAGSVYGYKGSAWETEYNRTYSSVIAGDRLGKSVALSADNTTLVAGSYGADSYQGSILIFYNTNWSVERRLIRSSRVDSDNFGYCVSVSSDGDKVATGAYGVNSETGAAYVYDYNGTTWILGATLTASGGAPNDQFGFSIAISSDGSTVVVGAPGTDTSSGSVYVYNGPNWGTPTKLDADVRAQYDKFGSSVAISSDGSIIVVGAFSGNSGTGAAYVCRGSDWGTQTLLTASDGEDQDYFGISVSTSADGNIIAVGASRDDDNGTYAGAVYVYSGTNWITETKHTAFDGAAVDYFGESVALSPDGSTLVVGSWGDDDNGNASGSAYILPPLHNLQ